MCSSEASASACLICVAKSQCLKASQSLRSLKHAGMLCWTCITYIWSAWVIAELMHRKLVLTTFETFFVAFCFWTSFAASALTPFSSREMGVRGKQAWPRLRDCYILLRMEWRRSPTCSLLYPDFVEDMASDKFFQETEMRSLCWTCWCPQTAEQTYCADTSQRHALSLQTWLTVCEHTHNSCFFLVLSAFGTSKPLQWGCLVSKSWTNDLGIFPCKWHILAGKEWKHRHNRKCWWEQSRHRETPLVSLFSFEA